MEPTSQDFRDVRRHKRVYFAFKVEILDGPRTLFGRCQRIANSGMYVFCPTPIQTGQSVAVRFALPGNKQELTVNARVHRFTSEDETTGLLGGMMLIFEDMGPSVELPIRDFVLSCIIRDQDYLTRTAQNGHDAVSIRFFGTEQTDTEYVVNISEGGAFIRTLHPLDEGMNLNLDLYLPGCEQVTRISGKVAWSLTPNQSTDGLSGMGINFDGVPDDVSVAIKEFVENFGEEVA